MIIPKPAAHRKGVTAATSFLPHFHRENNPGMSSQWRVEFRAQSSKFKVFVFAFVSCPLCALRCAVALVAQELCTFFDFFLVGMICPFINGLMCDCAGDVLLCWWHSPRQGQRILAQGNALGYGRALKIFAAP